MTFILKEDPYTLDEGGARVSRLLIETAAESHDVRALALAGDGAAGLGGASAGRPPVPIQRVDGRRAGLAPTALRALASRRSVIHTHFRVPELATALREDRSAVLIAEHTYMAESALDAGRHRDARLLVDTHVLESTVLGERRGPLRPLARIEARRAWRDEVRCASAADSAACLGEDDLERLRGAGVTQAERLDLLLPPAERPARPDRPRALFFATREWAPNRYALERLLALWPGISAQVPGAELVVAGRPARGERPIVDPSIRVLGFVDDLGELIGRCSVMLAPIPIGGGVRVKVLEAARHGLPVVGTPEAIGAVGDYLPLRPARDDAEFRAAAVELLAHPERAGAEGERLYEANRQLWEAGFVRDQVERWIAG